MRRKTPIEKRNRQATAGVVKTALDKVLEVAVPFYASVRDLCISAWSNSRRTFFDEFLLGLETALSNADEKDKAKIYKAFEDRQNDILLGEIVNSVIFSKGTKCRVMLGLIAAKYLGGTEIDYIDTIIITALKELLDEEINLFKEIQAKAEPQGTDLTSIAIGKKLLMVQRLDRLNIIKQETLYEERVMMTRPATKMEMARNYGDKSTMFPAAQKTIATERFMEYITISEGGQSWDTQL